MINVFVNELNLYILILNAVLESSEYINTSSVLKHYLNEQLLFILTDVVACHHVFFSYTHSTNDIKLTN